MQCLVGFKTVGVLSVCVCTSLFEVRKYINRKGHMHLLCGSGGAAHYSAFLKICMSKVLKFACQRRNCHRSSIYLISFTC